MRLLAVGLLALGLAGCGGGDADTPGAATQRGVDRAVADIRAAEAATSTPVEVSRSVGELTGKAAADASGNSRGQNMATSGNSRAQARAGSKQDKGGSGSPAQSAG